MQNEICSYFTDKTKIITILNLSGTFSYVQIMIFYIFFVHKFQKVSGKEMFVLPIIIEQTKLFILCETSLDPTTRVCSGEKDSE